MVGSKKLGTPQGISTLSSVASWTQVIIRALRARGIDGDLLAAKVGIDVGMLVNPEVRVPSRINAELWRRAVEATADPSFGIYASRFVTYNTFPVLSAAVLASETLRAAFGRVARYGAVIGDALVITLEENGDYGQVVLELPDSSRAPDEALDAALSLALRAARMLRQDVRLNPSRVELTRREPSPSEPFRAFFRAPLSFGAPRTLLEFTACDLGAPLPTFSVELSRSADLILERSVARLHSQDLTGRVRAAVLERLGNGEPEQGVIARALGVSARTLHRRLAEAGTSFHAVLRETRLGMARAYLAQGWRATDVALATGFSSVNSFSRAFRRWTGQSPSEVRRATRSRTA